MIGKNYKKTREKLRKLIINRLFSLEINILEEKAENHACYFCRKNIENKMYVLEVKESNGFSNFYLDEICYTRAKLFMNYDGTSLELN